MAVTVVPALTLAPRIRSPTASEPALSGLTVRVVPLMMPLKRATGSTCTCRVAALRSAIERPEPRSSLQGIVAIVDWPLASLNSAFQV